MNMNNLNPTATVRLHTVAAMAGIVLTATSAQAATITSAAFNGDNDQSQIVNTGGTLVSAANFGEAAVTINGFCSSGQCFACGFEFQWFGIFSTVEFHVLRFHAINHTGDLAVRANEVSDHALVGGGGQQWLAVSFDGHSAPVALHQQKGL